MGELKLIAEDRKLLLSERERVERDAGVAYKDVHKLRERIKEVSSSITDEQKKPDYKARVDKYEKKANKRVSEYLEKGSTASEVIGWIIKAPFLLFTIGAVITIIVIIIMQIINWNDTDDIEKVALVIGAIIILPIAGGLIALINTIGNLISLLVSSIAWDVFAFLANRLPEKNLEKYNSIHPVGVKRAIWNYTSKLYAHNPQFAQDEVIRFPLEHMESDFYSNNKHNITWKAFTTFYDYE